MSKILTGLLGEGFNMLLELAFILILVALPIYAIILLHDRHSNLDKGEDL